MYVIEVHTHRSTLNILYINQTNTFSHHVLRSLLLPKCLPVCSYHSYFCCYVLDSLHYFRRSIGKQAGKPKFTINNVLAAGLYGFNTRTHDPQVLFE